MIGISKGGPARPDPPFLFMHWELEESQLSTGVLIQDVQETS
jgi:hypothetical protein